jgi:CheY-like chemotaxis protein
LDFARRPGPSRVGRPVKPALTRGRHLEEYQEVPPPCSILLVEDDEFIAEPLRLLLGGEGYEVVLRTNGRLALDYLEQALRLPNLIFLDIMMPVMDGVQFRRAQLADCRWADIPVIVMTADAHVEERREQLKAQVFLKKPLELREILTLAQGFCQA